MLANICLQHFWLFGQYCNKWQNKSQSRLTGSGPIWNLIVPPIAQENFAASIFSGISKWTLDSDWSKTAPGDCPVITPQFHSKFGGCQSKVVLFWLCSVQSDWYTCNFNEDKYYCQLLIDAVCCSIIQTMLVETAVCCYLLWVLASLLVMCILLTSADNLSLIINVCIWLWLHVFKTKPKMFFKLMWIETLVFWLFSLWLNLILIEIIKFYLCERFGLTVFAFIVFIMYLLPLCCVINWKDILLHD